MKNKNHPLTYHLQMFTETLVQIFLFVFFSYYPAIDE